MELFTPGHLVVLAVIALVLFFGWKQLPDMTRSLGRSLRIFKTEIKGMGQDDRDRADREAHETEQAPRAIDPPPAQVVKNPSAESPSAAGAAPRPRPRPSNR